MLLSRHRTAFGIYGLSLTLCGVLERAGVTTFAQLFELLAQPEAEILRRIPRLSVADLTALHTVAIRYRQHNSPEDDGPLAA